MRWAVLVAMAACSAEPAMPMPMPIDYALSVSLGPPRADPPTVYIDGVPQMILHETYPTLMAAGNFEHRVELRYEDQILTAMDVTTGPQDCGRQFSGLERVVVDLEGLESGDIRYYGESVTYEDGGCVGDGSAAADCF